MTVTLNIDEEIVERARKVAEERGLSLDEFFGDVVQGIASRDVSTMPIEQVIKELEFLWAASSGDSRGQKWTREEIHERKDVP